MIAVGGYVRVSTSDQAEHGYSVGEQEDRIRKYCDALGWQIYRIYTDAGFSGSNIERPALTQLISDVKAKRINKIVVYKLDRLSRSQKDTLYLIEDVFLASGCDFVSMSENFDSSTAFGKAALGMISVFAQLERENIKERMALGRLARAKDGKYHGTSTIPIGYDYINGELIVNDFEALQVVKAHELYISGLGVRSICDQLNAAGMTHKHGFWQPATLRNVIAKRTYIGEVFYQGNWYKGIHEPILPQDLFDAAYRIKNLKHERYESQAERDGMATSILGGLIFCARCGAKYVKCAHYNTYKGKRDVIPLYKCASRAKKTPSEIKDPACRNKIYKQQELEDLILGEVRKLQLEPERITRSDQSDNKEISVIKAEREKIDDQLVRLMELYSVGNMPLDLLQRKTEELTARRDKLSDVLNRYSCRDKKRQNREFMARTIKSLSDVLERGNLSEIRTLLKILIRRIEIDGEDIKIFWSF